MNSPTPGQRGPYNLQDRYPGSPQNQNRNQNRNRTDPGLPEEKQPETLLEKLNGWRLGLSIEIEPIIRGLVCLILISFFALLQTTLFARFKPFGAVPDLMLPLVVAISMTAREKWGAVSGLAAAFIIESLGGSTVTILSLLYMPAGYLCGLLTVYYFRDGLAVRAMYTVVTTLLRCLFTLVILFTSSPYVSLPAAIIHVTIPEFFAAVLFAFLPHLAVRFAFRLAEGKVSQ
ncbi:MAG: hypothetical protein E7631_05300 [Ruminococcaceae bacterium]|nr:hypothetical protein [Oscillospiraceae bacterium]